jgi:hypothetical protein
MSELDQTNELEVLKDRADTMGIKYHPNISVEKLRERINEQLESGTETKTVKKDSRFGDGLELVRVNITCMNPAKKDWSGEIITGGNSQIGTVRKFVPFNTENGWHVPKVIFNILKERKFQAFRNVSGKNGITVRQGYMVNEFAIEELPPLTKEELAQLQKEQAARA